MLPRDLVSPVGRAEPVRPTDALADPRQQALQRALAPHLGKTLQGAVLARLGDGSYLVNVAATAARMRLPAGAQVGAEVPLRLVALQPRATFQVGAGAASSLALTEAGPPLPEGLDAASAPLAYQEGAAAQAATGRTPLARAAALLAQALPPGADLASGGEAGEASLSPAGKAIGGVLAAAQRADAPLTALIGRAPLAGAPGAPPAQIAAALQQALAGSGLFYESHVAQWAQGKRALAELAAEPQMQQAREGARPSAADPATAQFINLQLATHEQAQLAWQGQAWPGQPLHLEIGRDTPGREQGEQDEAQGAWHSRLRLRFPHLGEIDARLVLVGDRLHLHLGTDIDASSALLRQHTDALAAALDAAGTKLASLAIGTGEAGDD